MKKNITLFSLLKETLSKANIQIFLTLTESFLRNREKITVRSLSRYCGEYNLRPLFRFFGIVHNWIEISILVFKEGLYQEGKRYLIAISVYQQVVSGIAFMALSLIDVEKRKSYSIGQEQ
ncbi:MAG: hypothetical protein NZ455_15970, partial [Bacteroidia bacterium]|nr:hypothetical protein [Bacteroidia bacterium]